MVKDLIWECPALDEVGRITVLAEASALRHQNIVHISVFICCCSVQVSSNRPIHDLHAPSKWCVLLKNIAMKLAVSGRAWASIISRQVKCTAILKTSMHHDGKGRTYMERIPGVFVLQNDSDDLRIWDSCFRDLWDWCKRRCDICFTESHTSRYG